MYKAEPGSRTGNGRKAALVLGLAAPVLAGVAMIPSVASGGEQGAEQAHAAHDHSAHASVPSDQLAEVRMATARFHRVEAAVAAGYELGWVNGAGVRIVAGCVSHRTAGAMGYHYFNAALMADDEVNALEPEVLVYAPTPDGELKLAAVEWVARGVQSNPAGLWSDQNLPTILGLDVESAEPPVHMHVLVPPPGPAFYVMHAWVWVHNPAGMFEDWNPEVRCG